MKTCGHSDAWFRLNILEEAKELLACFDCVCEEIQELTVGWTANVERVGD